MFFYVNEKLSRIYLEGSLDKLTSKGDKDIFSVGYKSSDLSFNSYVCIKLQVSSCLEYDKKM